MPTVTTISSKENMTQHSLDLQMKHIWSLEYKFGITDMLSFQVVATYADGDDGTATQREHPTIATVMN